MDYSTDNDGALHYKRDNFLRKESIIDMLDCSWSAATQNQEDFSCMFDEATPVKDYSIFSSPCRREDNVVKEPDDFIVTSSQSKRRRMLNFDDLENDPNFCCEKITSSCIKSNEIIAEISEEALPDSSHWASELLDVGLDMQSQDWLNGVLNDADMHSNADDLHLNIDDLDLSSVSNAHHIDSSEPEPEPEPEYVIVQGKSRAIGDGQSDFKGRKAHVRSQKKISSSIAYPFAFIKPCAVQGDVTLKDINQRIRAKSNRTNEDHPSYPTSAVTGKPVVGRTKLCMDGGKGSLTIMRTRG